jgi:hypothetical protein
MAKQDVAVELFYDGAWHDLVPDDDVLADTPIVIQRGDGGQSAAPRPSSIALRLNNDADMFRTSNPESPLHGKAGVNTPLRILVGGESRGQAEVSSWRSGQTRDFRARPKRGKAWVDVEAAGLLQRLGQWTEPLRSPFRRYNDTLSNVIGYFPCEQARGSTTLISPTDGVSGTVFRGMAPDSQYRPLSSAPLLDMGQAEDAEVGAEFAPSTGSTTDGWQLSWVSRLETLTPGADTQIMVWDASDGTAYGLYLNTTTGEMNLSSAKDGVTVLNATVSYSGYDWSQWTLFSIDADYSGGTTTVWVNWINGDGTVSGFMNSSFAGEPAYLEDWNMSVFAGTPPGSTIGHVMGVNVSSSGGVDLFDTVRKTAWYGHAGETAGNRFVRLMTELGLAYATNGDLATSTAMGAQPTATLAEILREIRDTDDAVLFESKAAINLILTVRNHRYNIDADTASTPLITLDAADASGSGLPNLPVEVTDDLGIHNVVTAVQRDGGDYTVQDDSSPMGTQAPPDGKGEYRQSVAVNVADETVDLPVQAWWWLYRGTVDLPRFPQITVNLAALDAAKIAEVETLTIGGVIEIVGYREYTIRLHVIGYTEVIGTHSRTITFTCAPDQQFDVHVYDADDARYDLATCTMSAAAGPTATTLTLAITGEESWSTVDAYDLTVSGEVIGVPAGAMGARTGSLGAYQQVITGAVRSKNGIRKTLAAAAAVHVTTPARYAR